MKSVFKKIGTKKHSLDIGLLFAVILCSVISTLLIYSITKNDVLEKVGESYWKTQFISMLMGLCVAVAVSFIDYAKLVKLWFIYAPAALILVGLTFTALGYQREGADDRAWLNLGFIQLLLFLHVHISYPVTKKI